MNTPTLSSDYRIVRVLGQGGMGVVYEAEHGPLGRRVALKVLSEGSNPDPTALARLRREALAVGALQHPHVVQVSAFSEGPPPFLVMELLSGQSLRDRLVQRGPMRPVDACLVAVQLLSALGAAHRAGIVHRDVKPANVFVVLTPVTDVFVKLLDFGVAKLLTPQGPRSRASTPSSARRRTWRPSRSAGRRSTARPTSWGRARGGRASRARALSHGAVPDGGGDDGRLDAVRSAGRPHRARDHRDVEPLTADIGDDVDVDRARGHRPGVHLHGRRDAPPCRSEVTDSLGAAPPALSAPPVHHAFPYASMPVPTPNRSLGMLLGGVAIGVVLVVGLGGFVAMKVLQARAGGSPVSLPFAPTAAGTPVAPAPAAKALAGSCVIRAFTAGAWKSCTDHFGGTAADGREFCEKLNATGALSATWSDSPCVHAGAVFGCRAKTGDYTAWVYPPLSSREKERRCPNDEPLVQP